MITLATPRMIDLRVLSGTAKDVAQCINLLRAIEPVATTVGVDLGKAPVFVSIAQIRSTYAKYARNFGRTEASE